MAGYFLAPYVLEKTDTFNQFSYIGTIATSVALIIAIGEIIHAIRTTKSVQEQSIELLNEVKAIENSSSFSDCLASIDAVTKSVFDEHYDVAISNFQHFRKLCVKVVPGFTVDAKNNESGKLNALGNSELMLLQATKTHEGAPLNKQQKSNLLESILLIKQEIESLNPAKGESNASKKD